MKTQRQLRGQQAAASPAGFDPLAQMSGLVNLINASQAPAIQQQQYQQDFGLKQAGQEMQYNDAQAQYDLRAQAEQNNQANADRTFGLNENQFDLQKLQYDLANQQKHDTLQATIADRQAGDKLDMSKAILHMFSDPQGSGYANPEIGSAMLELLMGPGAGKLIDAKRQVGANTFMAPGGNPQATPTDYSRPTRDISNDAFDAARRKY